MFCTDTIGAIFCAASSCSTVDLRQADVADLALLPATATSSPTWSSSGTFVVDAVQLEQVDALDTEPAQAHLGLLAQIGRKGKGRPYIRARCAAGRPWSR